MHLTQPEFRFPEKHTPYIQLLAKHMNPCFDAGQSVNLDVIVIAKANVKLQTTTAKSQRKATD